jgi:hypothetical protein
VNLIKIHCKHISKCHSEAPLYNYCMLINKFKKKENELVYPGHVGI